MTSSSTYGMTYVKPGSSIPDNAPKRSLAPTECVGIERKRNSSEKRVSAIPTQAIIPSTNRTGLMPKLGEAGPEERTICILDFDYGAVTQMRQVFPGPAQGCLTPMETTSESQSERCI